MKKILVSLIILGLIGVILYLIWNQNLRERKEEKVDTETRTILPVAVGNKAKLLDTKSNTLISIPGVQKQRLYLENQLMENGSLFLKEKEKSHQVLHHIFFFLDGI